MIICNINTCKYNVGMNFEYIIMLQFEMLAAKVSFFHVELNMTSQGL